MNRIVVRQLYRMCSSKIVIPQAQQGNKLSFQGKFKAAQSSYQRAIQIAKYGKLDDKLDENYVETVTKLAACYFLNKKYNTIASFTGPLLTKLKQREIIQNDFKCLSLIHWSSQMLSGTAKQSGNQCNSGKFGQIQQQIKKIVMVLLNIKNQQINNRQQNKVFNHVPVIKAISELINDEVDYRQLLTALVERKGKTQKVEEPKIYLTQLCQSKITPEIFILYHLGIFLNSPQSLTTGDKKLLNNHMDSILKSYQKTRPTQVFKPLLNIIISLIAQKHYMSAEGMVGYLKNEQLHLINSHDSQDRRFISNLYRMLVTRANNQSYEEGWQKEEKLELGKLVIERVVKARLLGHPAEGLIC